MNMRYSMLAAVALALLVGGAVYMYSRAPGPAPHEATGTEDSEAAPGFVPAEGSPASGTTPTGPLAPPRMAPPGFKEYRSAHYRFALFYPNNLKIEEYNEGGGVSTITFQNEATATGFQIFVIPYSARQVSAERFRQDAPSGVMLEPTPLAIDGVPATMFFSRDALLGETREVWFIHGGYLFEVTTPKALDASLAAVMLTWKFI